MKVLVEGFGWVSVVLVLDWYTNKLVGRYAGIPCTAWHWLATLAMAVNRQFPGGSRAKPLVRVRSRLSAHLQLLAVQAARYPGIVAPGHLPAQPLRQVLRDLIWCLSHSSPSSVACLPAIEESGPSIKVSAYVGTSESRRLQWIKTLLLLASAPSLCKGPGYASPSERGMAQRRVRS
jgi:hypothetical protein